uniref:Endonuclease/exonuclease/phosphatase domain-containing protein n=1 Tax=Cajanus cajan TaxID=3821 RepID=A0A151SD83_CAJCA|nr:hypothetical protein KK1_025491 [Cajanus cajan]
MSGGLLSIWRRDKFTANDIFLGENFIGVAGTWKENNILCSIVNLYAPCDVNRKKELWSSLIQLRLNCGGDVWCFGGDFNAVRSGRERKGVFTHWRDDDMQAFDGFIQEAFLVDLPLHGRKYTWYKSDGSCMSRLDRFLVSDGWLAAWSNTVQWGLEIAWSNTVQWGLERGVFDHCAVLLKNEEVNWGPKPFRVLDCWRNDVRYKAFVKSQWREIVVSGRAVFVLKEKLKNLKIKLRTWNKDTFGDLDRKISKARDNFNKMDLKSEVSNLQEEDVLQNEIRSLEVANETYYEPSAIKEAVTGFYEKHFEERSSNRLFLNDPAFKFLQEDEAASLILPFTEEEVKNAVWDCDGSKSPGPNIFDIQK